MKVSCLGFRQIGGNPTVNACKFIWELEGSQVLKDLGILLLTRSVKGRASFGVSVSEI